MIIDCFTFYNELNMLKFRFKELYEYVDYFILVEATTTFVGNNKELYFKNNKNMFSNYLDKVIHIIVDDMPKDENPWVDEKFQRNCIQRGIKKLKLKDDDILIISDCDEIINTKVLLDTSKIKKT